MIKFSIIVPVYKVEAYIRQCVNSLLSQTFSDYEIILVDDGSPDNCPKICDEYSLNYNNVITVHKVNGGLSDARNKGLAIARGEYVTFVDSDDFWSHNNVLSDVYHIIEKYNPDIILGDCIKYYTSTNKYIYPQKMMSSDFNGRQKSEILNYLYYELADLKMAAWQKFVRRNVILDMHFTKGLLSEDIDWSLKVYPIVNRLCLYEKPYYCYRQQRSGSITQTASQSSFDSLIAIIKKWSAKIPEIDVPDKERELYNGYLAYQLCIAIRLLNNLDRNNRKSALKEIIAFKPLFKYPLNSKTKKVYSLISILGISLTSKILRIFLMARHKFNSIRCQKK